MKKRIYIFIVLLIGLNVFAAPNNIARTAKVKASSEKEFFLASGVNDGQARIIDNNEWVSKSGITFWGQIDYPWIELSWEAPKKINKIIIYDRPNLKSHVAGITLHFSDGSRIFVNSIPNNGAPKVVEFATKETQFVRCEVTDADGMNVGLSEVEVFPSIDNNTAVIDKVNPYVESARGRGDVFFITGQTPFGMIGSAPHTRNKNQYGGGYNYNSQEILGFVQLHGWMNTGISLMPTTGSVSTLNGDQDWKSHFSHDGEIVQPGYHKLFLDRYNMWVEQTATDRVSMYKFKYCGEASSADILVDLGGFFATSTMVGADVKVVSNSEIEGSFISTGRLWKGPENVRVYFVIQFDAPANQIDGWMGQTESTNIKNLTSTDLTMTLREGSIPTRGFKDALCVGIRARYDAKPGSERMVKVAVSYTSIENARLNMEKECNHWDFEKVRADCRATWNEMLGRIDVKGGSEQQQVKLYTDLWHVLLGRQKIDDVSGDYPDYTSGKLVGNKVVGAVFQKRTLPKDKKGNVKFHMYNSDAFWLTQWNLNVLWGLAWPEVLDDFAACLVQYSLNGGLLPRGPNLGGYSYIMSGCPATNLITSAYQKGMLTKMDPKIAFDQMVNNHKGGGMLGTVEQINHYEKFGHYPNDAEQTIEASFQDWALSQMALKMGKKKETDYYLKRSKGWETLYNPDLKLLMPKTGKETWLHNDPLSGSGWIETNAWQATWSVSHGLKKLSEFMGGNQALCEKLNFAFEQSRKDDFVFGYSSGYVSYANQPGCSNAHVFGRVGNPYLTQYWVRRVKEQAFGATTPDRGYGGHDEDQGQMGGISALMAIGLFSVTGTSDVNPIYDITSPVFDSVIIKLPKPYYKGKTFKIISHNNSDANYYIQKSSLNGKPFDGFLLNHSDYAKGGVLELWMGDKIPTDFKYQN